MTGCCRQKINNGDGEAQPSSFQRLIHVAVDEQGSYRECRRNHAAIIGRYALDGCGEFLKSGDGNPEALICAACGCHRNFHRKELPNIPIATELHLIPHRALTASAPPLPPPLPAPLVIVYNEGPSLLTQEPHDVQSKTLSVKEKDVEMEKQKKARRTRFTEEQKDRMTRFAEKLGWRPQRHDEEEIQQFCSDMGISRVVFKVWLRNTRRRRGIA